MKLLFDQMLSPLLVRSLANEFPESTHTHALGMATTDDTVVRTYAGANGFTIVTKDSDHESLCLRLGWPPKVVKINTGNCLTALIHQLLLEHRNAPLEFEIDTTRGLFWIAVS